MSESKHTPGPWRTGMEHGTIVAGRTGGRGYVVAEGVTRPADAALIARAPDLLRENEGLRAQNAELLEAAEKARDALDRMMGDSDLDDDDSPEGRAMRALVAAIAKAKGGAA